MALLQQFSRDIGRLLDNPHNTHDVIVRVGEGTSRKEIKLHSVILNARCPHFQKLLMRPESLSKENGIVVFERQHYSPKIFNIILKYLYTGVIESRDHDTFDLLQILIISHELELTTLTQHLIQHLIENQSKHLYRDPLKFLRILSRHHHDERFFALKSYCFEIICENPNGFLFASPEFLLLEKKLLLTILNQDFLDVRDEVQVWNHVLKWGIAQMPSSQMVLKTINNWTKEECDLLREILSDFLPMIRWMDISLNDILNKVAPYSNVLPKDFCREIFNAHRTVDPVEPVDPESILSKELPLMDYIKSLPPRFPLNSLLITPRKVACIASWIDKEKKDHYSIDPKSGRGLPYRFKLLYRASRDGYDAKTFHALCDNKGPTVTIAKVSKKNLLIGGYNPLDWKPKYDSTDGNSMYQTENSFLFCFGRGERKDKSGKAEGKPRVKSKISKLIKVTNPQKAIYYSPTSGPCFGSGCDLGIINNQIVSYGSPSYDGINRFIKEESRFDLDDYEVFQVIKSK